MMKLIAKSKELNAELEKLYNQEILNKIEILKSKLKRI